MNQLSSFVTLDIDVWKTYVDDLFGRQQTGDKRREVISYLKHILDSDEDVVKTYVKDQRARKKDITKRLLALSHNNISPMFTSSALTTSDLHTLTASSDKSLFIKGYTFTNILDITGDRCQIYGESNGLAAIDEKLLCTAIVNKTIKITGKDCVVDGVQFNSTNEAKCIEFGLGAENITFRNCKFVGDGSSETKWFYGVNFKGSVTLDNCWVEGYGSWYLADFNSDSSDPSNTGRYLTDFTMKNCYIKNCAGSIACRGATNQLGQTALIEGNKFVYGNYQHAWFWSAIEVNNFVTVTCRNNTASGVKHNTVNRGFFQCWSKDGKIELYIQDNSVIGFNVAYQLAFKNAGTAMFYGTANNSYVKSDSDDSYEGTPNFASIAYQWDFSDSPTNGPLGGDIPTFTTTHNVVTQASEWIA